MPPLIHYRVLLRTLSSAIPPRVWVEPKYDNVQSVEYVSDPLHPGFKRLSLTNSPTMILHEELIFEGSSQFETRHFEKTLSLAAHTFDGWIPIKPIPGIGDTAHLKKDVPTVSAKSHIKFPLGVPTAIMHSGLDIGDRLLKDTVNVTTATLGLGWEDGAQTWVGHHREMAETNIQVRVRASWQADKLQITVDNNRPEDRNYVLSLVVEEIANAKLKDYLFHYATSDKPKVGGPVERSARLGELATDAGVERFTAALHQFEPDELKRLAHQFKGHKSEPKGRH